MSVTIAIASCECMILFLLILFNLSTSCYNGGTPWNGTVCVRFFGEELTYTAAHDRCRENFHTLSSLAHADSDGLGAFLVALAPNATEAWIGLRDATGMWDWRWEDDNTPLFVYAPWLPMEPSNDGDCVVLDQGMQWNDHDCASAHPFFCTYPLFTCANVSQTDSGVCRAHGACRVPDNCTCTCYSGADCEEGPYCHLVHHEDDDVCGGPARGHCASCDSCACVDRHMGLTCTESVGTAAAADEASMMLSVPVAVPWEDIPDAKPSLVQQNVPCASVLAGSDASHGEMCTLVREDQYAADSHVLEVLLVRSAAALAMSSVHVHSLTRPEDVLIAAVHWTREPLLAVHEAALIGALAGVCVIGAALVFLFVLLWCLCCRKREKKRAVREVSQVYGLEVTLVDSARGEIPESVEAQIRLNKDLFHIKYKDLDVKEKIGQGGASAVVFRAEWRGRDVAFKCFSTGDVCSSECGFAEFEKEASLLVAIRHPNIVAVYGCTVHPPRVGIVMEYCANGDLMDYLSTHTDVWMTQRLVFVVDLASALCHVHSLSVLHRDVKPQNVLLSAECDVKLADFGLGRCVEGIGTPKTTCIGTSGYMAPEIASGSENYGAAADVFSFGVTTYAVLTGNFYPYGETSMRVDYRVAQDPLFRPDLDVSILLHVDAHVRELMQACWAHDPAERPEMEEVLRVLSQDG